MPVNARDHDEREQQQAEIEKALLNGVSIARIVADTVKQFGVCKQTVYNDIKDIKRRWADGTSEQRQELAAEFQRSVLRREMLFNKALQKDDDAQALRVEQDRCKLLGLYPEDTVTIKDGRARSVEEYSDAELAAIIASGNPAAG